MKTPINVAIAQEREHFEQMKRAAETAPEGDAKNLYKFEASIYLNVISRLQSLLPAEREAIEAAWNSGSGHESEPVHQDATDYFTTKYTEQ